MLSGNEQGITVLMPVYNAEKYLREAVESILEQTFRNFEFLIIDDGSTDSSVDIIRSYTDPRIRLVQNETNRGITYTLNRGIQLASHELIARMDADDISHANRLEVQYKYALEHPDCALISTWVRRISSDRKFEKISGLTPAHYRYSLLFSPTGIFHPTVLFKRSAVMEVGLYSKAYAEDYNLWCKLVKKHRFCIIPEPLLDYRSSETSLWRVTKKSEYEQAHDQQILENVHFYAGNNFELADHEIKFLRGNIEGVRKDKQKIIAAFRKLDRVTSSVRSSKAISYADKRNIDEAAFLHKMNLFAKLRKHLPEKDMLTLMTELGYWRIIFQYIKQKMERKSKQKLKAV